MGKKKRLSGPEGLLIVDKPLGPTSHDVVGQVRKALKTRTVGHAGTLDPLATGVLVVLVGRYTRLSPHLTNDDKRYTATIRFGARTTTDDAEGEVLAEGDPLSLDEKTVRDALETMVGPCAQVPPAFSAVRIDGQRMHAAARAGKPIIAPPRDVVLHGLDLLAWRPPEAIVDVQCSKGTYVRAIARDLGEALGVPAHLSGLVRTASGAYALNDACALDDVFALGPEALVRGRAAIRGMPIVDVDANTAAGLRRGRTVVVESALDDSAVGLAFDGDEPIAVVQRTRAGLKPVRGFPTRVDDGPAATAPKG